MWRGLLIGAGSALGLSVLLVGGVSLLAPAPNTAPVAQPGVAPAVPVMETTASDPVPNVPQPLPERPDSDGTSDVAAADVVEVPASSPFNRPREDVEPVTPGQDDQPRLAEAQPAVPPGLDVPAVAPRPDTASAELPQASLVVPGVSAPEAGQSPKVPAPVDEGAPQTFREVVADAVPVEAETSTEIVLSADPASAATETEQATDETLDRVVAEGPVAIAPEPTVTEETAAQDITLVEEPVQVPAPGPEHTVEQAPIVPRRIILDSARESAEAAEDTPVESRALVLNGEPFENPEGKPLFGIVLIDDPSTGIDRDNLLSFQFPVTFAIDPTAPDAAEAAAAYRAAGHEVVMRADGLALNGDAQDVEISLAGALAALPTTVGVLDRTGRGFASNRQALAALLPPLAERGMGFVTFGGGLNSGVQTALRQEVPAQSVYRVLDDEGQRATVITRYLDRATFAAAQDGVAIVVGRTSPETVTALFSWALGRRSQTVAVAPISHILRKAGGE